MKKFTPIFVLALIIFQIQSTNGKPQGNWPVMREIETRAVSNFTGISSSGHFDVLVTLGSSETLQIEGSTEALENTETIVENGVLKIRAKNRLNKPVSNLGKVTVRIMAKSLNALAVSGSGSLTVDGVIDAKTLNTSLSGSGSLSFDTNVSDLKAIISGSGSMTTRGTGSHAVVTISGSGRFIANDLKVKTAEIRLTGSGDATIDAKNNLSAILIGSGNIFYGSDPQVDILTKIGTGNISKI